MSTTLASSLFHQYSNAENNTQSSQQQQHQQPQTQNAKPRKTPNWTEFYKNVHPDEIEVIVISDDEDEDIVITNSCPSPSKSKRKGQSLTPPPGPALKKQKTLFPVVNYVPISHPVQKASLVKVPLVKSYSPPLIEACDDDKGHMVIVPRKTTLANGRFVVTKVLGQGTFGKVVSAFDIKKQKQCAVKIIRAIPKYREASMTEIRVLTTIFKHDPMNSMRTIHLQECFDYKNHICIVTDLLGISIFDFLESNNYLSFPKSHVKSFAKQLFSSVAYLHRLKIVHTDLKPENILLKSSKYYTELIPNHPKHSTRNILEDTTIHLIDFGSAIYNDEYHSSVVSTRHYRAPEVIFGTGWSFPCDIWSIGCILVEFCTGEALFPTYDNLEHLALMQKIFNKNFSRDYLALALSNKIGAELINKNTGKIDYPNAKTKKSSEKHVKNTKTLRHALKKARSYMVVPEESKAEDDKFWNDLLDLLGKIFVYNPVSRITAEEALKHPFLNDDL